MFECKRRGSDGDRGVDSRGGAWSSEVERGKETKRGGATQNEGRKAAELHGQIDITRRDTL